MGLPAGSKEAELGAVDANFTGVTPGVERVFPLEGKGRAIAGVRGRGIGR